MAPLRSNLLLGEDFAFTLFGVGSLLAAVAVLTSLLTWFYCACCQREKRPGKIPDDTHMEEIKQPKTEPIESKNQNVASTDHPTSSSTFTLSSLSSDKSFPTVFAMQIPRQKGRKKPFVSLTSSTLKSATLKSSTPKSTTSTRKNATTVSTSLKKAATASIALDQQKRSVMVTPSSTSKRNADTVSIRRSSRSSRSSNSSNCKVPGLMLIVVLTSMFASTISKTITNENVCDVALTICPFDDNAESTNQSTGMSELLEEIAATWPIGDTGTRIGVVLAQPNSTKMILPIHQGGDREKVRRVKADLSTNKAYAQRRFGGRLNILHESEALHRQEQRNRMEAPLLSVFLIIFRSNITSATNSGQWKKDVFDAEIKMQLNQSANYSRPDISVVFETGSVNFGGVWRTGNGAYNDSCCVRNVNDLVNRTFSAVKQLLAACRLERKEQCYRDNRSQCMANVNFEKISTTENRKYCLNRNNEIGNCSNPDDCSKATDTDRNGKPNEGQRGGISWGWVGTLLSIVVLVLTMVVVASVRQCVIHARNRREEQSRLSECGYTCAVPKKGSKKGVEKKALASATSIKDDSLA